MVQICEWLLTKTNARGVVFITRDGSRIGAGVGRDADVTELLAATEDVEHGDFVHRSTSDGLALACPLTCGYLAAFFDEMPDWRAAFAFVRAAQEITRRFEEPHDPGPRSGNPGSGAPARRG